MTHLKGRISPLTAFFGALAVLALSAPLASAQDLVEPPEPTDAPGPDAPAEADPANGEAGPDGEAAPPESQGPVLTPPELRTFVQARYPEAAIDEAITTTVVAVLFIDATGKVVRVDVQEPSPYVGYGFDEAAVAALSTFEFAPATRDGEAIPARLAFAYDFIPPGAEEDDLGLDDLDPETLAEDLPDGEVPDASEPAEDAFLEATDVGKAQLRGTIRERGTRRVLPGVLVSLQQNEDLFEVYSDAQGRFVSPPLSPGAWQILIAEEAYGDYATEERLAADESVEVVYFIERAFYDSYGADGAYVYETVERRLRKEVTRRTLNVTEIQRIPGAQGDALKVIENLPGVARSTFNSGQIIVRGSAPQDTLVLLDGANIPLLYHFGGLTSVVPSDILSAIDFYPGNFSTRYGRVMGGVLDAKTRAPRSDRLGAFVDIDVIDIAAFVEGPIVEDLSFQLSARRSYIDAILPAVLPDDIGGELTVAPRYWDYQSRINWRPFAGHELELFVFGSDDVLKFLFDEPRPENPLVRGAAEAGTSFHRAQVSHRFRSEAYDSLLLYQFGTTVLEFSLGDSLSFLLDLFQHQVRHESTWRISDYITLIGGLDILFGTATVIGRLPKTPGEGEFPGGFEAQEFITFEQRATYYEPAAFLETEIRPIANLLFTFGGRLDYNRLIGQFNGDIRGAARWQIDDYWAVKGGIGRFSQPPQPQDTTNEFGNPDLGWQHATHYSLGGESRLPLYEPLSLDVTAFYKDLDNLVAPSTNIVTRNDRAVPENLANSGSGRVYGMEILLRHDLANNFFGWVAYTLSRAERRDADSAPLTPFDFDQTHILTLVASYKLPHQWQIGARFRYVTGRPFTPRAGAVFDADADRYRPVPGETNSDRIEAFHQLDLRVDKSWVFDWWILSAYLDIQNVYFHANPEAVQYNFDSTQSGYVRGLPILPSIGIKGEF